MRRRNVSLQPRARHLHFSAFTSSHSDYTSSTWQEFTNRARTARTDSPHSTDSTTHDHPQINAFMIFVLSSKLQIALFWNGKGNKCVVVKYVDQRNKFSS